LSEHKVGVGLVGLGGVSYMHEAGYQDIPERIRMVALCDLDRPTAAGRASQYGARTYSDFEDLVRDPEVELVDICLPHHLHYKVAKRALESGKHVLLEKPMASSSSEALELIEISRRMKVKFTVAENTRHVRAYQEAEKMLSEKKLGEIWLVRTIICGSEVARLSDPSSWLRRKETGGGVVLDAGVHTFYLLGWLFGGVRDVKTFVWSRVQGTEVEDNAVMVGRLENGAQFQSQVSDTVVSPWNEKLEVHGSLGSLFIDQLSDPPAKYHIGTEDYDGTRIVGVEYNPLGWKFASIVEEVKDMVDAILQDRPPLIDVMDAYRAVKTVEMAYASASRL
jgi:UDP-N-acetylglucosamine 3-dehydrogenase